MKKFNVGDEVYLMIPLSQIEKTKPQIFKTKVLQVRKNNSFGNYYENYYEDYLVEGFPRFYNEWDLWSTYQEAKLAALDIFEYHYDKTYTDIENLTFELSCISSALYEIRNDLILKEMDKTI